MKHFRSHAAVLAMVGFLTACSHWTPVAVAPSQLPHTGTVRATLRSGEQVVVRSPLISGDTLWPASTRSFRSGPGIPLSHVSRWEVEKTDGAWVFVGVVAIGAVVALASSFKFDLGCFTMCSGERR